MSKNNLDIEFQEAFDKLSELKEGLAPDTMLKLYAYYKQGISGDFSSKTLNPDVRDAFKFNAWTQLNGMPRDEAKKEYIKLAKEILSNNNLL